jgi:glycerol kinase
MQLQADYLGVDVVRPKMIATTSAGAAYLAALGAGVFTELSEIRKIWKIDKTFKPKMTAAARGERLDRWSKAIERALITD